MAWSLEGEKALSAILTHLLEAPKPSFLADGADVVGVEGSAVELGVGAVDASTGGAGGSTGGVGGTGVGTGVVTVGSEGGGGAGGTGRDGTVTVGRLTSGGGGSWPALVPAQAPSSPRTSSVGSSGGTRRMCL
jgi:hypothetical protein